MEPLTDPYCGLSLARHTELRSRVRKGILFINVYFKTSRWIPEVCSRHFTLHCLRTRALKLEESSFFADVYRQAHSMGRGYSSNLPRTILFGLELEKKSY